MAQVAAPAEATCTQHPLEPAAIVCAQCGVIACARCEAPDGTHCAACRPGEAEIGTDEPAGPAAALALFGGPVGEAIHLADSLLDTHVRSARRRRRIRLVVLGSIALAMLSLLASLAPRS